MTTKETNELIDRHIDGWLGSNNHATLRARITAMIAEAVAARDKLFADGQETMRHERDEAIKARDEAVAAAHLAVEEGAKDKARLDWLEDNRLSLYADRLLDDAGFEWNVQDKTEEKYIKATPRAAIDAAMQP